MAQQREARLVNEYLADNYPTCAQWKRVRLGPAMSKEDAAMYSVLLRWADAVVFDGSRILIIEGKMSPNAGAIGQLEYYDDLFLRTPEFSQYHKYPVKLVLLSALEDVSLASYAKERGIDFVVQKKPWSDAYLRERFRY